MKRDIPLNSLQGNKACYGLWNAASEASWKNGKPVLLSAIPIVTWWISVNWFHMKKWPTLNSKRTDGPLNGHEQEGY